MANAGFSLIQDGQVQRVNLRFIEREVSMSGIVLDQGSNNMPVGARVVLYGVEPDAAGLLKQGRVIAWTDTDPVEGRFSFANLYPGPFRITASNPFHPDEISVSGTLVAGEKKKITMVFQKPLGRILGVVVGPDGKTPAVSVIVKTFLHNKPIEVTTDAKGFYRFGKMLPQGVYQVEVNDPETGLRSEPATAMLEPGGEVDVPLRVLGKGAIEVRVLTASGRAASLADVKVKRVGVPADEAEGAITNGGCDPCGMIRFDALHQGTYAVSVRDHLGRGARGEVVIPAAGKTGWVSLVLDESGVVDGFFMGIDKTTPISPARLTLFAGESHKAVGVATTKSDGAFLFENVPMGQFSVEGYNPATGRRAAGRAMLSVDGQVVSLLLIEEGLGAVAGKMLAADKITPVPGVKLTLTSRSALGLIHGISRPDGSFLFDGIPVGAVSLKAEDRRTNYVALANGAIEQEGEQLNLFLIQAASGDIEGQVIFADLTPVPYALVLTGKIYLQADEAGRFLFPQMPLESYTIQVNEPNGPRSGTGYASITQHGEKASAVIKLSGMGAMTIRVYDRGTPVAGAKITISPVNAAFVTPENGEVLFERLPQGSYTITATSSDQIRSVTDSARIRFDQEHVMVRMELGPAGSIRAQIKRGDGVHPAEGTVATLLKEEQLFVSRLVPEDGTLSFNQIPTGSYILKLDEAGTGKGTVIGAAKRVFAVEDGVTADLGTIVLDSEPIRVLSIEPADAASNVDLNFVIRVRFSEPLNRDSLSGATFQVIETIPTGTRLVDGKFSFNADQTEIAFTPNAPLTSSGRYKIKITGITDQIGHEMVPLLIETAFTAADRIPPKMVSIAPSDGTIEVAQEAVIRVVFSEPIAAVSNGAVILRQRNAASNDTIPIQISLADGNKLLIVKPANDLRINQHYKVLIEQIADLSGNLMKKPIAIEFSTKDTIPPVVNEVRLDEETPAIPGKPFRVFASGSDDNLKAIEIFLNGASLGFANLLDVASSVTGLRSLAFTLPISIPYPADLTAVAIDVAGNRSIPTSLKIVPADGPPVISIVDFTDAGPGESAEITIRSEDDKGLSAVRYSTEGAVVQTKNRPLTGKLDQWVIRLPIPETAVIGNRITFMANVTDQSGQSASTTHMFYLMDNKKPSVEIISANSFAFGSIGEIKIKASDANSPLTAIALDISGAVALSGNFILVGDRRDEERTIPIEIPLQPETRMITITAFAVDQAGNRGEAKPVSVILAGGIVTGTVFRGTSPIAGISVLADTGLSKKTVTTDAAGRYLIKGLMPGVVRVIASDTGLGLGAMGEVTLTDNGEIAHLDLILQPAASLIGKVLTAKGKNAGKNITVTATAEGKVFQKLTDDAGAFIFDFLPLTQIALTASAADGSVAEGTIRLVESGQKITLGFIARGTVSGQVVYGDGKKPVGFSAVTLYTARSGYRTKITLEDGKFSFDNVFAGSFRVGAVDPVQKIDGTASGEIVTEGEIVQDTISLTALGSVRGTVYAAVDHQPVVGVTVTLSWPYYRTTQTDLDGKYYFSNVPVNNGWYGCYLSASDSVSGDSTPTQTVYVEKHEQVVVADLTLIGFGEVQVVVKSPSGLPVEGAEVLLAGVKQWSDANGAALFNKIRPGQYSVQSKLPAHPDGTTSNYFTVQAGKVSEVVMTLQKRGTILGRVFAPDGVTPVAEVVVSLGWNGRRMLTDRQGRFSFSSLSIGSYYLEARVKGQLRASPISVMLSAEGEVKEHHFVLLPFGTVTGTISDSNGAPAANASISINHKNPLGWQGRGSQTTIYSQSDGSYQAENIPLGHVTIDARKQVYSSSGSSLTGANAEGSLGYDQEVLVLNLSLTDNIVQLPASLQIPGSYYTFSQTGSVKQENHISRECECSRLSLTVDGQTAALPTGLFGKYEDNRQEVSTMMQEGPGGIVMTRKLYVPKNGYAVRGLELLNNPTDEPMTVTLQLMSAPSFTKQSVDLSTPEVQSGEGWIMLSGGKKEGIAQIGSDGRVVWRDTKGDEAVGLLFGRSAKRGQLFLQNDAPVVTTTTIPSGWLSSTTLKHWTASITYGIKDVIIKPGETVGLLHFYFMPWNKEGEQPTLNRLRSLPPEMLAGLSPEELSSIINFDLEEDRDQKLTAPQTISKLSVNVFQKAGEQLIPLPNMRVDFKSADPIYPLTYSAMTDTQGLLVLDYKNIPAWYNPPSLPEGQPVDLHAFAHTGLRDDVIKDTVSNFSPTVTAVDEAGVLSATLVFTETGVASFLFERPGGITGNAKITLTHQESKQTYSVDSIVHPKSSATFLTLPPGHYEAAVFIDHPQSQQISYRQSAREILGFVELDVVASLETAIAIPIEPTGHLEGKITTAAGSPAGNQQVSLTICKNSNCGGSAYLTTTDATGRYQFVHLPIGPVNVAVRDPHTGSITQAYLDIVGGATGSKDLILAASGKIRLKVVLPNGLPAIASSVSLVGTHHAGQTNDQGMVLFKDVLVGSYTVRAFRPETAFSRFFSEQSVVLNEHNEMAEALLPLPAAGTVSVKVETASGVPVSGQYLRLIRSPQNTFITDTNARGYYPHPKEESIFTSKDGITKPVAWTGPIAMSLKTQNAFGWTLIEKEDAALLEGENRIVVFRLQTLAHLSATVTVCGKPSASRKLVLFNAENKEISNWTNKEGKALFNNVYEGEYHLRIRDLAASVLVSVTASDEGRVIDIAFPLCTVNVKGRVVAGDGETGIPNSRIVIKNADGEWIGWLKTGEEGEFETHLETINGEKITIAASAYIVMTSVSSQTVEAVEAVQTVTIETKTTLPPFVLPVSVVKAKTGWTRKGIYIPIAKTQYYSCFAINPKIVDQYDYARSHQPYYFQNGRCLILGLPLGDFEVTIHDLNTGKTVTKKGSVETIEKAVEIDLLFSPINDLLVRVKDVEGWPVKAGVIGVEELGSPFTIFRRFSEEDSGSFWKSEGGKLLREGGEEEAWTWNEKRGTFIREVAGGLWIRDKETQQESFHSGIGGEWIFKGEVGEVLLEGLPASAPLVVAFADKFQEEISEQGIIFREREAPMLISKPVFVSLPESNEQIIVTLLLPRMASISGQMVAADGFTPVTEGGYLTWEQTIPTPFGSRTGQIAIDDQGRFNAESANPVEKKNTEEEDPQPPQFPEFFDPGSGIPDDDTQYYNYILDNEVRYRLAIGGRTDFYNHSIPITRSGAPFPNHDRGILTIEQIRNPYPAPITLPVKLEQPVKEGEGFVTVLDTYAQSGGGIQEESSSTIDSYESHSYLFVFGSSLGNQGGHLVVPALSCRTIVHLWDILPTDGFGGMGQKMVQGENFTKGVDLLNRFATLDLRKFVEDPLCPLAE